MTRSAPTLLPGTTFEGKYHVVRRLGGGGFGDVYLVKLCTEVKYHKEQAPSFALKVAHELESEASIASFFNEVGALRRLHNRHIVTVRDVHVTTEGVCYFTMDLAPGKSLNEVLKNGRILDWRQAVDIACQVLEALDEAHQQNVVHRDVKPENIMVETRQGEQPFVRVLDFGIAELKSKSASERKGSPIGTFRYMAPEQFESGTVDGRADLYATAIVLFEAVTGEFVYEVPADAHDVAYMFHHNNAHPVPIRSCRPELALPAGLEAALLRALRKEPSERFAAASEMRAALLAVLRSDEMRRAGDTTWLGESDPAWALGEIGPYVLEEEIGNGGGGKVYRARPKAGGPPVALKMQWDDCVADEVQRERFRREATMAGRVRHPNAVAVLDFGEHEGRAYMALEYVEGESLHEQLAAQGALPPLRAAEIARDVLDALATIHDAGIVHRDIKPKNVIISKSGATKVCDYGIGRIVSGADSNAPRLTVAGSFLGTPGYAAPEVWRGDPIDVRTDLYALGILIFEILTGRQPFKGENFKALSNAHCYSLPPKLVDVRPEIGRRPGLEAGVSRLLAKNPAERFATAREAWSALSVAFGVEGRLPPLRTIGATPTPAPSPTLTPKRGVNSVSGRAGDTIEAHPPYVITPTPVPGSGLATAPPWTIDTHARLVTSDRTDFVIASPTLRFGRDKPVGDRARDNGLVLRVLPYRTAELDPENFKRTMEISKHHGELSVVDGRVTITDNSTRGIALEGMRIQRGAAVPLPPRFRIEMLGSGLILVGQIFADAPGSARPIAVRMQRLANAPNHAYVWVISAAEIGTHGGPIPHAGEGSFGAALIARDGRLLLSLRGQVPRPLVAGERLPGRGDSILVGALRPEDMLSG